MAIMNCPCLALHDRGGAELGRNEERSMQDSSLRTVLPRDTIAFRLTAGCSTIQVLGHSEFVPRPVEQVVWADRAALKAQVERLGRRLGKHEAVSLHLPWADFGAGKTHTLLYLKQEADKGKFGSHTRKLAGPQQNGTRR